MMIFTLAFAMTVAMLIATGLCLHEETQKAKLKSRVGDPNQRRPHF